MHKDKVLSNDWHVVARKQDLQPGSVLQKRLLGEDIVLWRYDDNILACQDFCPHRGARLSLGWVKENTLICPYHGLAYNTHGKCVYIPANPDKLPPTQQGMGRL